MLFLDTITPSALSLVSLLSASTLSWATASAATEDFSSYLPDFLQWKRDLNKTYPSRDVEDVRRGIWIDNRRRMEEHNSNSESSWKHGT